MGFGAETERVAQMMSETVFDRISEMLDRHGVRYEVTRHEPVYTSEEAARVRGTSLSSGAKALLCKVDKAFVLAVLPAHLRLDSKETRRQKSIRSLRFAAREEVDELTELAPGAIPPFGSLFNLPTWCDHGLAREEKINFNAGDHAVSISMTFKDYQRVENPEMARLAEEEGKDI